MINGFDNLSAFESLFGDFINADNIVVNLSAEKGSAIMAGILPASSRMRFMESLASGDARSQMQFFDTAAFDAYYIPGGRLHSIGEGNTLLEIGTACASVFTLENTASDPEGKAALQQALSCVDFMDRTVSRITGASDVVARNRKFPIVKFCPSFHAEELLLVTDWHDNKLKIFFNEFIAISKGGR